MSVLRDVGKMWMAVTATANDAANCHQLLATRFTNDLEKAVRSAPVEAQWIQVKSQETAMSKLVKEYEDKLGKAVKYKKQLDTDKTPKADAKSKKLDETKVQLDIAVTQWKSEAPTAFEAFETYDRAQVDFVKSTLEQTIEFQINNLRIQLMNLEQMAGQIANLNPDMELEAFHASCTKTMTGGKDEDVAAIKEILSSLATGKPAGAPADLGPVDADGYRIPQMDVEKWKNEVNANNTANGLFEDDEPAGGSQQTANQHRIKFDIQNKSSEGKVEDLTTAAAFMRDTLGPTRAATVSRRRTGSHVQSVYESSISPSSLGRAPAMSVSSTSGSPMASAMNLRALGGQVPAGALKVKCMEILNAKIASDGSIQQLFITGAILLNPESVKQHSGSHSVRFRINPQQKSVFTSTPAEMPGFQRISHTEFSVELDKAAQASDPTIVKYRVESLPSHSALIPLKISSRMRAQPKQTQLVISYERNAASICTDAQSNTFSKLSELAILVDADPGTRAVVTKPLAAFHQEKKKIMWKMGDLPQEPAMVQDAVPSTKLLAQWEVQERSKGSAVSARFVCEGVRMSGIDVQLVGDDGVPSSSVPQLFIGSSSGCSLTVETSVLNAD